MIYIILFPVLIYLNSAQPILSDYPCSVNSDCDTYDTTGFGFDFSQFIPGAPDLTDLAGENATCSTALGHCTG